MPAIPVAAPMAMTGITHSDEQCLGDCAMLPISPQSERLWILQFTEAHRRNGQFGVDFLVCGSGLIYPH